MSIPVSIGTQKLIEQKPKNHRRRALAKFKSQGILQVFALMGILELLIFSFIPMVGLILAFKDYKITMGLQGFFTSEWVGLKWLIEFCNDIDFWLIIRNTVVISALKLLFTFPVPIIFALALNETKNIKIKRVVQTVSYMPYFISWVVVAGMMFSMLNQQNGLLNQLLMITGASKNSIAFLSDPKYFWPIVVISDIWKGMGWWSIIFLAAISGVDLALYEAAVIDGASRLQKIWHITLPSIKGTIMIVLILSIGNLFAGGLGGSNFDQCYMLGNVVNHSHSEILQTYTLKMGLAQGRYPYATAVGLFQSVISLILIYSSNYVSRKLSGTGLF